MALSQNCSKSFFLGHCPFTQLFNMLKIEEKTKNIHEGPIKILVFTTYRVIIEKFHQKQPKFQPWWNSSVKKKPYACYAFKDSEIKCLQPPLFTHSCLCVFFSKAALIKSKAEQIFNKTILKIVGTHFFLVESLAVWRIIRNQFEPSRCLMTDKKAYLSF